MALLHWWPLNHSNLDKGSYANNILSEGGFAGYQTGGKVTLYSARFNSNASGDLYIANDMQSVNPNTLSISAWVKLDSSQTGWGQIVQIGSTGTSWESIRFGFNNRQNTHVIFNISDGTNTTNYNGPHSNGNLQDNTWHHIVGTYDNGVMRMYVDGVETASSPFTTAIVPKISDAQWILLGSGDTGEPMAGNINDVRIYDHALSNIEVKRLSKGICYHLAMNQSSTFGGKLQEYTYYNYAALVGSSFSMSSTTNLGSYSLHCVDAGYTTRIEATGFNPSFITNGTVCFWYKKDAAAMNYNNGHFIAATGPNGTWLAATGNPAFNSGCSFTTSYLDGVQKTDMTVTDTDWHFYCYTGVNLSQWSEFNLHKHGDDSWCYRGYISDYKVFATSLTTDDMAEMMHKRAIIDNKGNIFCNDLLIDQRENVKLPSSAGVVKCGEVCRHNTAKVGGYSKLQYIESNGNCYIDTGVSAIGGTHAKFKAKWTARGGYMVGSHAGSDPYNRNGPNPHSDGSWELGYGDTYPHAGSSYLNTAYDIEFQTFSNNAFLKVDGNTVISTSGQNLTANLNVLLFANQYNGMSYGNGRMYYCKLYNSNGRLIRDFVPVRRNSDNAIGMLDKLSGTFYGNSGSGIFTAPTNRAKIIQCNNLYICDGYAGITEWKLSEKTLQSISINTNPTKMSYNIGETFNLSGMKLNLIYDDGSTEVVSSGWSYSPTSASAAGSTTVTITYQGKTTTLTFTILGPYTMLEYIESTGTQYIDTGVSFFKEYQVNLKAAVTESTSAADKYLVAPSYWNSSQGLRFALGGFYEGKFTVGYGKLSTGSTHTSLNADNNVHYHEYFKFNTGDVEFDIRSEDNSKSQGNYFTNISNWGASGSTQSGTTGLRLFWGYNSPTKGKIYWFAVFAYSNFLINLDPARRNSDGAIGMLDRVSGNFFTNAGTGTFIAGPEKQVNMGVYL